MPAFLHAIVCFRSQTLFSFPCTHVMTHGDVQGPCHGIKQTNDKTTPLNTRGCALSSALFDVSCAPQNVTETKNKRKHQIQRDRARCVPLMFVVCVCVSLATEGNAKLDDDCDSESKRTGNTPEKNASSRGVSLFVIDSCPFFRLPVQTTTSNIRDWWMAPHKSQKV